MSSFDLAEVLKVPNITNHLEAVDKEIVRVLATEETSISKPLDRLIKAKGKRLRPILVIAVASSQGKKIDKEVISCCAAVELIHLSSLVHDDIIDEAQSRWNTPTINSKEGTNQAIVIGDYILANAFSLAARSSLEVVDVLTTTFKELCEGQSRELMDQYNKNRSRDSLMRSINGKTAALMWASCKIGALCSKISDNKVEAFACYGQNFGMAYQLIDDVLDYISSEEQLGKAVCNDIKEGVYTLPLLITLESPGGAKIKDQLGHGKDINVSQLVDLMVGNGSINQTLSLAKQYNDLAVKSLDDFPGAKSLVKMIDLPNSYMKWALNNLVDKKYFPKIKAE